jgi:hypothetical protein
MAYLGNLLDKWRQNDPATGQPYTFKAAHDAVKTPYPTADSKHFVIYGYPFLQFDDTLP